MVLYIFCFFTSTLYFSCFNCVFPYLLEHIYKSWLKCLFDNSHITVISLVLSVTIFSHVRAVLLLLFFCPSSNFDSILGMLTVMFWDSGCCFILWKSLPSHYSPGTLYIDIFVLSHGHGLTLSLLWILFPVSFLLSNLCSNSWVCPMCVHASGQCVTWEVLYLHSFSQLVVMFRVPDTYIWLRGEYEV